MADTSQDYATHRRYDPAFHVFVFGVLAINLLVSAWNLVRFPGLASFWGLVTAAAFVVLFFKVRLYALKVQDRVIRLEERLRLAALLPEPQRARIPELTVSQLIGIRFASDAEVPKVVEQALAERLDGEEIKKRISSWRADEFRV